MRKRWMLVELRMRMVLRRVRVRNWRWMDGMQPPREFVRVQVGNAPMPVPVRGVRIAQFVCCEMMRGGRHRVCLGRAKNILRGRGEKKK